MILMVFRFFYSYYVLRVDDRVYIKIFDICVKIILV